MQAPVLERLEGQVERVTFHSAESGFCVLKVWVRGEKELITVVDFNAHASAGEHIEAKGQWFNDKQHGFGFFHKFASSYLFYAESLNDFTCQIFPTTIISKRH